MELIENTEIKYALVTGATGGLGKAFSKELAKQGYTLLLTGRNKEKLSALQEELRTEFPETQTRIYAVDLSNEGDRCALTDAIRADGVRLSLLANVAGVDIQKGVAEYTQEKIVLQCRVNLEAAVSLCQFAITHKAETLKIVNVASVSGIYPMPYFAIYSATKSALVSFSVALREEMRGKDVSVTAVLPGAIPTRDDIKEQIKGQGLWGKLAALPPETVARDALKAVNRNKPRAIIGFWNNVMHFFTAWMPESWHLRYIANRWSKISKDAF